MKQRCDKPHNPYYCRYGGRGIKYDERWSSFEKFLTDMESSWEKGTSLDRIDNNGDYCKENCRWATPKIQSNNRRNRVEFEFKGESHSLPEWADILGMKSSTLRQRYYVYNWPIEKVLSY